MMNDLCSIESKEFSETTGSFLLQMNGKHPLFAAHFPGNPVVPGVIWLWLTRTLSEKTSGKNLIFVRAVKVKFLHALDPDTPEPVKADIQLRTAGDILHVRAGFSCNGITLCKAQTEYRISHTPD